MSVALGALALAMGIGALGHRAVLDREHSVASPGWDRTCLAGAETVAAASRRSRRVVARGVVVDVQRKLEREPRHGREEERLSTAWDSVAKLMLGWTGTEPPALQARFAADERRARIALAAELGQRHATGCIALLEAMPGGPAA
jgi:hypothetical protein